MTPADIPKVRVVGPDGKVVIPEGYYFEMPERTRFPMSQSPEPEEIPVLHCIVTHEDGDWGMACTPRIRIVTPPHRIEVIEEAGRKKGDATP